MLLAIEWQQAWTSTEIGIELILFEYLQKAIEVRLFLR